MADSPKAKDRNKFNTLILRASHREYIVIYCSTALF